MSEDIDSPFNACMFKKSCLKLKADRDALLEALKRVASPMAPHRINCGWARSQHESECDCAVGQARAAIAQAEKEPKP